MPTPTTEKPSTFTRSRTALVSAGLVAATCVAVLTIPVPLAAWIETGLIWTAAGVTAYLTRPYMSKLNRWFAGE